MMFGLLAGRVENPACSTYVWVTSQQGGKPSMQYGGALVPKREPDPYRPGDVITLAADGLADVRAVVHREPDCEAGEDASGEAGLLAQCGEAGEDASGEAGVLAQCGDLDTVPY